MSSVRIASLNPSPSPPISASAPSRHPLNSSRASGCGAIVSIRSATTSPGASAGTTNARDVVRAAGIAGAREHAVEIGDAAVRDPHLCAVEDPMVRRRGARASSSRPRPTRPGSDSANAAIASPARDAAAASARFCAVAAGKRDRAAAEALHREREIGEPVVPGERLARDAKRCARRAREAHRRAPPGRSSAASRRLRAARTSARQSASTSACSLHAAPARRTILQARVASARCGVVEERPVEVRAIHRGNPSQLPAKTGFVFATNAS